MGMIRCGEMNPSIYILMMETITILNRYTKLGIVLTWVNVEKLTNTYDGSNNRIAHLIQSWIISDWVNTDQYSYTYDENNNRTEYSLPNVE